MITIRNLSISSQRFEKLSDEAFVKEVANGCNYETQFTVSITWSEYIYKPRRTEEEFQSFPVN